MKRIVGPTLTYRWRRFRERNHDEGADPGTIHGASQLRA